VKLFAAMEHKLHHFRVLNIESYEHFAFGIRSDDSDSFRRDLNLEVSWRLVDEIVELLAGIYLPSPSNRTCKIQCESCDTTSSWIFSPPSR
jgi:glucose-6-phosphate 1-dehydrogenase